MASEETTPLRFSDLGLRPEIVDTLTALGYEAPTPIQERTIPILLEGRDVIGQAQTGTGKTAAFALPLLQALDPTSTATQALVLTPTRELAVQVAEAIHSYSRGMGHVSILPVYGGAPIVHQLRRLERGVTIVVGTPGRLIDHLDRGTLKLGQVRTVVLDEADEMLRMGFIDDVERILSELPEERRIALFSATMPAEVRRIAEKHLRNAARIEIEHKATTTPAIDQRFISLHEGQKLDVLTRILEIEPSQAVLIFRRTKNGAAELAERLESRGFAAVAMHGDMAQSLRESVIRRLKGGQAEIVVATDVAARGLDVEHIEHVVNYDIPNDVEAYVHRIGRTGRAGRSGRATLFVTPRERRMLRDIERFTGRPIRPMSLPSPGDVAARRIEIFKGSVKAEIEKGELDLYLQLVSQIAEEGPFDVTDVAAAVARMASGNRSLESQPEPAKTRDYPMAPPREAREYPKAPPREARDYPKAPPRETREPARPPRETAAREYPPAPPREYPPAPPRASAPPRDAASAPRRERPARGDEGPKVRLSISLGKNDGIRPGDVVGSIANEADVPGSEIGPIEILDEITFVTVPEKYKDQVLERTARAKFRGKRIAVREVGPGQPDGPARRPAPRPPYGDRPRAGRYDDRGAASRPPRYAEAEGAPRRPRYAEAEAAGPRSRATAGAARPASRYGATDRSAPARGPRSRSASDGPPSRARYDDRGGPRTPREGAGERRPFYERAPGRPPSKFQKRGEDRRPSGPKKGPKGRR